MQALGYFVDLYGDGLAAVNKYIANAPGATREAVGREIHSMGGAAAALGAVELEEAAHRIDKLMRGDPAKPADDGELRPALERLRRDLAELVAGLSESLGRGAQEDYLQRNRGAAIDRHRGDAFLRRAVDQAGRSRSGRPACCASRSTMRTMRSCLNSRLDALVEHLLLLAAAAA